MQATVHLYLYSKRLENLIACLSSSLMAPVIHGSPIHSGEQSRGGVTFTQLEKIVDSLAPMLL